MQNRKKILLTIIALAAVTITIVVFSDRSGSVLALQDDLNQNHEPIAEYATPNHADAARRDKNKRLNKPGAKPITDGDQVRVRTSHWWSRLSALPVEQSDLVVVAEVVNAEAFLSDDKTNVYSEFTLRVEESLKHNSQVQLPYGSSIVAERQIGAVRFPSGRIQRYKTHRQDAPQTGKRYVLFLKRDSQTSGLAILTGYELRAGRVIPLDGEDVKDQRADLPFAKYRGTAENTFLGAVREAIAGAGQPAIREVK